MPFTDLIPWKRGEKVIPIHRESDDLLPFRREMFPVFDDFFRMPFGLRPFDRFFSESREFMPRVDVSETEKEITLTAELPGMDENDINISLNNDILTIKGEKKSEREEKDRNYYFVERSFGSFCREFRLPGEVDEGKIEAIFKNGVLTVTLPKTAESQQLIRRIPIKKS